MPKRVRPLVQLAVGMTCAVALLSGCTSDLDVATPPDTAPSASSSVPAAPTPSESSASPSAATASTPTASASASQPSTPSASVSPSAAADTLAIDITIANDKVSPNGKKINVKKGQTVVLNVTSDEDDEIHAHTTGDGYELEVEAGKPATGSFVADGAGSFEVESHHLEKIIAILVVR